MVMFHGVGVSSGIFSLDTIETNLVEFLVKHRYHYDLIIFLVAFIIVGTIDHLCDRIRTSYSTV